MRFVTPGELPGFDPERVASARECVVAMADGPVQGPSAAVLILADYAVATPSSSIILDDACAWAGVVHRIGAAALSLRLTGPLTFDAIDAEASGLIDEVTDDLSAWRIRFMEGRSALALDAAAMLIGRRGGDALERAEFARLFAAGEPQRGLRFFLEKRRPQF